MTVSELTSGHNASSHWAVTMRCKFKYATTPKVPSMDRSISTTLQITAAAILLRYVSIGEITDVMQMLCIWLHLLQAGKPASSNQVHSHSTL